MLIKVETTRALDVVKKSITQFLVVRIVMTINFVEGVITILTGLILYLIVLIS